MWRGPIFQGNIILELRRHIRLTDIRLTQVPLSKVLRCGGLVRAAAALAAGFDIDGSGEEEEGEHDNNDVGDEMIVGTCKLKTEGTVDDA